MRILPVLFNTDMVQAIQDDRKTVTRRCLKHPFTVHPNGYITKPRGNENLCPYEPPYRKGDVLWVRETWGEDVGGSYIYKADYSEAFTQDPTIDAIGNEIKWKPSIHMPKAAARIWLEVLDVKVERLQDMTLDDFLNEGISIPYEAFNDPANAYMQAKEIFMHIWNSTINKKQRNLYDWDANPYVWVISFKRTDRPNI